ncbi:hypothetical protein [Streptomyces sp. NPDC059979]|uniref:hypothetical protein n=1 Tax=unclassified Streptomyces TaxID=2593676 RepID=UPI0036469DF4
MGGAVGPRPLLVPVDPEHPYPYVEEPSDVQQWPETADGADRDDGTWAYHPQVRGTAEEWPERLSRALEPVLGR